MKFYEIVYVRTPIYDSESWNADKNKDHVDYTVNKDKMYEICKRMH